MCRKEHQPKNLENQNRDDKKLNGKIGKQKRRFPRNKLRNPGKHSLSWTFSHNGFAT